MSQVDRRVARVCEANMWSFRAIGRSMYFLSQSNLLRKKTFEHRRDNERKT